MSTRGWFIFKYKGKYYVFYNQSDSYPDIPYGLCSRLINELKKYNLNQLIELLENFILLTNKNNENDEYDEDDEEDDFYKHYTKDIHYKGIEETLKNPNYNYKIKNTIDEIQERDLFIEYKYIINLDEELFTMTNELNNIQLHFELFNIPHNWFEFYIKVFNAYKLEKI